MWRVDGRVCGWVELAFRVGFSICIWVSFGVYIRICVTIRICVRVSIPVGVGVSICVAISISIYHFNVTVGVPNSVLVLLFFLLSIAIRSLAF
jgi:hypothetical protein